VRDIAATTGAPAKLLLWTQGASKGTWRKAGFVRDDPHLDARCIASPAIDGIFHVKLAGVADAAGDWTHAVVGSCNLTSRALAANIELGVVIRGDTSTLDQLRAWFAMQFERATPASAVDWERAIDQAPESIAKVHGRDPKEAATPLATPVAAEAPVAPPELGAR
jgi:hypothetical protein